MKRIRFSIEDKTQFLFFVLGGFFITNALVAELIGGKIFSVSLPSFLQTLLGWLDIHKQSVNLSVGIIPWPIVFVATDLVNEFFGRKGVRFYTFVTIGLIIYAFFILQLARVVVAADFSPVSQEQFDAVFGTSQWIIFGSLVAFAVSQLVDVLVFARLRNRTGGRHLWARATGSTVVSQLIDTFIIGFVAFYLPGTFTWEQFVQVGVVSYLYKVVVAILITPLCYVGHGLISRFLGPEEAKRLAERAAKTSVVNEA